MPIGTIIHRNPSGNAQDLSFNEISANARYTARNTREAVNKDLVHASHQKPFPVTIDTPITREFVSSYLQHSNRVNLYPPGLYSLSNEC